jgi:SlyX protein
MTTLNTPTDERLTQLEIKISYTEDLLDTLNALVAQQQDQIDLLMREVARLRQQDTGLGTGGQHVPGDELPPHY